VDHTFDALSAVELLNQRQKPWCPRLPRRSGSVDRSRAAAAAGAPDLCRRRKRMFRQFCWRFRTIQDSLRNQNSQISALMPGELEGLRGPSHCRCGQRSGQDLHIYIYLDSCFCEQRQVGERELGRCIRCNQLQEIWVAFPINL
jgi:hypothetical protein